MRLLAGILRYYITMPAIGVIGGSGLYEMEGLEVLEERQMMSPYGEPSAPFCIAKYEGQTLAFLPRHGLRHNIHPHRVNYRANLWAMRELGVERIFSVCSTGGITEDMAPGALVVLDQVIDWTQGARASTFYEDDKVVHVDFTEPFCPELRGALLSASRDLAIEAKDGGTYLCVNGPRLESRAEIEFFKGAGAHVVGMTGMPEAALARELEICYSSLAVVTNRAAGITGQKLTTTEVVDTMKQARLSIEGLIKRALSNIPPKRACRCKDALKDSEL